MHVHLHARSARSLTVAALALVALAACSKEKKVSARRRRRPVPPPRRLRRVPWRSPTSMSAGRSPNAQVTDKTDTFKPADTVYTSVHTTGSATAATVMARWTFEDGQVVQESSQSIAPTGDAYTEFHISKPAGLPKGKYKVEVFLDSKSAGIEGLRGEVAGIGVRVEFHHSNAKGSHRNAPGRCIGWLPFALE